MSKTRSDNVLLNLPEEQQCKLADWLLNGMPYHEANVLVGKEFGVALRSLSSYSAFWREVCEPALLSRRSKLVKSADARVEEAERRPGQFDKATLDAISERAYALAISPQSEAKDVKAVMMLLLKARDQELHKQELGLALDKYRDQVAERKRAIEAELGKARTGGGLTPETLERIERELKLL
jgi:hypothetical protein